jgi:hypothetical protein
MSDQKKAAGESSGEKWVRFEVSEKFVRLARKDDEAFWGVTLPMGTHLVDGRDLGGGRFTLPEGLVMTSKFNEGKVCISLPFGWSKDVKVPSKGEDGHIIVGGQTSVIKVVAADLKAAVEAQLASWRDDHKGDEARCGDRKEGRPRDLAARTAEATARSQSSATNPEPETRKVRM